MNVHIPITFPSGEKWLARIRQQSSNSPKAAELREMIMRSEIETMRTLRAASLKVPDVYTPPTQLACTRSGVKAGTGEVLPPAFHRISHCCLTHSPTFLPRIPDQDLEFFFIQFLEGHACPAPISQGLSAQKQAKVIESLASFYIDLSQLSFSKVGSLVPLPSSTTKAEIGPLITLDFHRPNEPPYFFGPFSSSAARYMAHIEYTLTEIAQGKAFTDNAAEVYVTHLWLRDFLREARNLWAGEDTYIKHADDKGDQIMSDDDGDIVGIIDWEW
jgi:hypothetical protein